GAIAELGSTKEGLAKLERGSPPAESAALTPLPGPSPQKGREAPRRWRRLAAYVGAGAALVVIAAGIAGFVLIRNIEAALPAPLDPAKIPTSTIVVDKNSKLLRPFTTADGIWRLPVDKGQVDPRFLKMLIGYEDRRFTEHHGVDYKALARAAGQFVLA